LPMKKAYRKYNTCAVMKGNMVVVGLLKRMVA
jgi:hypothetical protein